MDINRRNFFKVAGLTGISLAAGKRLVANNSESGNEEEFYGMLYDSVRCKGCCGCEIDCADQHGLPYPEDYAEPGVVRKTNAYQRTVVNAKETSKGTVYVKTQCMNCNDPACGAACLTQAMHKTTKGPIIWREDKCMGCRYCMVSCPFEMPRFEYESTNPIIQKCDMCFDLIKEGESPLCAFNCPNGALTFGKRRDLINEARKRIHDQPEAYYNYIYGEHEAGGTGWLYLSPVPFEELGFNTSIQKSSYPALTKGFISAIAPVDILLPAALLGIHEATKNIKKNEEEEL